MVGRIAVRKGLPLALILLVVQRFARVAAGTDFEFFCFDLDGVLVRDDDLGRATLFDHVFHDNGLGFELGRAVAALGHELEAALTWVAAQLDLSHLGGVGLHVVVPGCVAQERHGYRARLTVRYV